MQGSTRKTVLITGANRGIGLGLTEKFLQEGWYVFAASRNPDGARELWELEHGYPGRCTLLSLDVTRDADCAQLAQTLKGADTPLDVLINNAGVFVEREAGLEQISADAMVKAFQVNTVGSLRVTQAALAFLRKSAQPVVGFISSQMGSIADNSSGGAYSYRASKAALNAVVKSMAVDLPGVTVLTLHPGWVQTDMGGSQAPTSVTESAAGLYRVLTGAGAKGVATGSFLDFRGQTLPW